MFHRLKLTVAAASALAMPGIAQAQTVSADIQLSSTVDNACGLGAPSLTVLDLHDLTGPDGKLDPSKTGAATLASTVIADAWCNAPHSLTLDATPMALQGAPSYAQPSYMAREITYWAKLVGWGSGSLNRRPKSADDGVSSDFTGAYAAQSPGLTLNVSDLETLTADKTEQPGLMLEAGHYKGTVTITLTTSN